MSDPSRICVAVALQRYFAFTPLAERQRSLAAALAKSYGAAIEVITVEAALGIMPDASSTEEKLAAYVEPMRAEGLVVRTACYEGRPSRAVLEHLEGSDADLLLLGSHSKRGVLDIALGSTANVLLRQAPCTVLLVRPTQAEVEGAKAVTIPDLPFIVPGT